MAALQSVHDDLRSRQYCGEQHALYVVGYLQGCRPTWLDCDRPLRVLCKWCDFETRWACGNHRKSRCKPCAGRYRRRVRTIAESGMRRPTGYLYLVTTTAPSEVHYYGRSGDLCPCSVEGFDLAAWNASHSGRWNHFRTLLKAAVPELQYVRGVEVQSRGALHDHAIVWSPVPLSKAQLKAMALAAGFGHEIDLAPLVPGSRKAAYYISKYITKATDSREAVPWLPDGTEDDGEWLLDLASGEVLRRSPRTFGAPFRTWSMSRHYGLTMKAVRADARDYAEGLERTRDAEGLVVIVESFGGELTAVSGSPP